MTDESTVELPDTHSLMDDAFSGSVVGAAADAELLREQEYNKLQGLVEIAESYVARAGSALSGAIPHLSKNASPTEIQNALIEVDKLIQESKDKELKELLENVMGGMRAFAMSDPLAVALMQGESHNASIGSSSQSPLISAAEVFSAKLSTSNTTQAALAQSLMTHGSDGVVVDVMRHPLGDAPTELLPTITVPVREPHAALAASSSNPDQLTKALQEAMKVGNSLMASMQANFGGANVNNRLSGVLAAQAPGDGAQTIAAAANINH